MWSQFSHSPFTRVLRIELRSLSLCHNCLCWLKHFFHPQHIHDDDDYRYVNDNEMDGGILPYALPYIFPKRKSAVLLLFFAWLKPLRHAWWWVVTVSIMYQKTEGILKQFKILKGSAKLMNNERIILTNVYKFFFENQVIIYI